VPRTGTSPTRLTDPSTTEYRGPALSTGDRASAFMEGHVHAYQQFWASLDTTEWVLMVGLLAALILVAVAAAAFGNPTSLDRRPVRLPDKRPAQDLPATPEEQDQLPYLGAHRESDPQERTINLGKYRRYRRD